MMEPVRQAKDGNFREEDHPRDKAGRFRSSNGESGGNSDEITDPSIKSLDADLKANNGNHLKAARAFYRREFQGKHVVVKIDGKDAKVTFIGSSWQHLKRDIDSDRTKAELIPYLADIIKTGRRTPFVKASHSPYEGFHYFYKRVDVGGKSILAVVDVGRRSDGAYEYNPYSLNHEGFFNFRKKVDEIEKATQKRITDDASNYDPVQVHILGGGSHHPFKAIITHDAGIVHIGFNNQSNNTMKRPAITFDAATRRRFDDNGFLHVDGCHITKEQVAPYYGFEIPDYERLGLNPQKIYYGYRSGEELQKGLSTFNGLPLLLHHHPESAEEPQKEYRVGSVGTSATWNPPYIDNVLSVTDKTGIKVVQDGSCREISSAYQYDPDFTKGEFEGQPYDFVMRNIRGNHVALVEEGRAGPDVVVADAQIVNKPERNELVMIKLKDFFRGAWDNDPMKEDITEDDDKVVKVKAIIDGLSDVIPPEKLKLGR